MSAYRCTNCGTSWPFRTEYKTCAECGESCDGIQADSIDEAEAKSRKNHADFERWLDEHNRRDPVEQLERIPTVGT